MQLIPACSPSPTAAPCPYNCQSHTRVCGTTRSSLPLLVTTVLAMADVLLGSSERRVLISALPPAPESLLCRLDQIDSRLRQLEEQRRDPAAHADECDVVRSAQHQHTKSLPSALQHVQLMDRLNLLESRIRQLSCELDLDDYAGKAALGLGTSSAPMLESCRDPAPPMTCMSEKPADESWSAAVEILHKDARHKANPSNKVGGAKRLKEAKKCACQKEKKKKAERNKTNKRSWFGVGC